MVVVVAQMASRQVRCGALLVVRISLTLFLAVAFMRATSAHSAAGGPSALECAPCDAYTCCKLNGGLHGGEVQLPVLASTHELLQHVLSCARAASASPARDAFIHVDYEDVAAHHVAWLSSVSVKAAAECDVLLHSSASETDVLLRLAEAADWPAGLASVIEKVSVRAAWASSCNPMDHVQCMLPMTSGTPPPSVQALVDSGWIMHDVLPSSAVLTSASITLALQALGARMCVVGGTDDATRIRSPTSIVDAARLEIVVAHCREDLSWIYTLQPMHAQVVHVYSKCGADVSQLRAPHHDIELHVHIIENRGGEEYVYLRHMLHVEADRNGSRSDVERIFAFLQGAPTFHTPEVLQRVMMARAEWILSPTSHAIMRATGFEFLTDPKGRVQFDSCNDHCGLFVHELYETLFKQPFPAFLGIRYAGMFMATEAAVRRVARAHARAVIAATPLNTRYPTAFMVERLWPAMFGLQADYEEALIEAARISDMDAATQEIHARIWSAMSLRGSSLVSLGCPSAKAGPPGRVDST